MDSMNIPLLSMTMAQSQLQSDIGVAMLSKSLDMNEILGANLTDMISASAMELSVSPHLGANIDMLL